MDKRIILGTGAIIVLAGIIFFGRGAPSSETALAPPSSPDSENEIVTPSNQNTMNHLVTIKTSLGTIVIKTYDADAPKTVENFVTLAQKGYYNGLMFHRVIKGFMIQGGDPYCTNGVGPCGTGGPGYTFEDELNPATPSYQEGYRAGVVAMANAGPNTNGSQFFIMHTDYPLPHNYTIFGKVVEGQEVVNTIATTPTGPNDQPVQSVIMETVTVQKAE
jgi:cyclophilin family peptidyl-prolyl cis-trans isomerase